MNVTRPDDIWTSKQLYHARKLRNIPFIVKEELSWHEQRNFIDKSIEVLGNIPLAENIKNQLDQLKSNYPSNKKLLSEGYTEIKNEEEWENLYDLDGTFTIAFNKSSGAITTLKDEKTNIQWATINNPLLRFMYRSHSLAEASNYPKIYNYNHGGQHPYHEPIGTNFYPGMNMTDNIAKKWYGKIISMWVLENNDEKTSVSSIIVKLKLDDTNINQIGYGAPSEIMLNVSINSQDNEKSFLVELVWEGKVPTRLFETIWLEVRPALQEDSDWSLLVNKIGSSINVSDVVNKGGSSLHGFDPNGGITFFNSNDFQSSIHNNLNIKSLDCGVVAPGFNTNPWKYDVYDNGNAVDPLDGAAFFLYGNLYNTNYVLWYPFIEEDNMSRFRFEFTF